MLRKVWLIVGIIGILFFSMLISSAGAESSRIAGFDRYITSTGISSEGWTEADSVVIATGQDFPDALAGGPLAYHFDAPIILTAKYGLGYEQELEIERLGAVKAYILGGESVVSAAVADDLRDLGLEIERIGGKNRYETAAMIASYLPSDKAVVANGRNFPDALAVAPYAARHGIPILLTEKDSLPSATASVTDEKSSIIMVGSAGVISSVVENQLPDSVRYGGKDRYETADKIINGLQLGQSKAYVATGMNFADALAGSVLAAKENAPILLVKQNEIPSSIAATAGKFQEFVLLGGPSAVSEKVRYLLDGKPDDEFTIQGIHTGMTELEAFNVLGEPDRRDPSRYNFDWYIYNGDYSKYIQVGIANGRVVAMYSNSNSWVTSSGIKLDLSSSKVEEIMNGLDLVHERNGVDYYHYQDKQIFFDYDQRRLSAVTVLDGSVDFTTNTDASLRSSLEKQIFDITNAYRVYNGKLPLTWDEKAMLSSRKHSKDMAVRSFFDHTNPDGLDPFDRMIDEGIRYSAAGENIAAGYYDAMDVHDAWVNSPGHRQNLLADAYSRLGVGVHFGGDYGVYYTQNFYRPY